MCTCAWPFAHSFLFLAFPCSFPAMLRASMYVCEYARAHDLSLINFFFLHFHFSFLSCCAQPHTLSSHVHTYIRAHFTHGFRVCVCVCVCVRVLFVFDDAYSQGRRCAGAALWASSFLSDFSDNIQTLAIEGERVLEWSYRKGTRCGVVI